MAFLELKLALRVQQKQILTPGLVQMVSLLALNKLELSQMISQELAENPVLEEATDTVEPSEEAAPAQAAAEGAPGEEADSTDEQYRLVNERESHESSSPQEPAESASDDEIDYGEFQSYLNNGAARPREIEVFERPSFENFLQKPLTLTDHLEWQLGLANVDPPVRDACRSIIGNLNEDGYLVAVDENGRTMPLSLEEIAQTGDHALADVQTALAVVQDFDPPGVAARDLRECLLIQLKHLGDGSPIATAIVEDHLRKLQNRQYREIARVLAQPVEAVMEAIEIIKSLDPRPGQKHNKTRPRLIVPDVFFVRIDGEWRVLADEDDVPQLRLSPTYRRLLERGKANKEVKNYVRDCFKSALQLLRNIEQRRHIIIKVCEAIIRRQGDFLDRGIDALKPMMIKEVAEEVGVHPSTVSRAVANKFAHTPQGVFVLRYFFSEAVSGASGNGTSLLIVKRKVRKLIEGEDPRRPLTDEKVAALLKAEGISVTRRSVTKYREDLKIPSTHQRRVLE